MASPKDPIISIVWSPQDLVDQFGVTADQATRLLETARDDLEERSIELGWEILEELIEEIDNG
jgi:hypothetical protein